MRNELCEALKQLQYERGLNMELAEKMNDLKNQSISALQRSRDIKDRDIKPRDSREVKALIDSIKTRFLEKFEESNKIFIREIRKMEEKLERLDIENNKLNNEVKVIKKLSFAKYKQNQYAENIKTYEIKIEDLEHEIRNLKSNIEGIEKDINFYQQENAKQRDIIRDLSDETEIERNSIKSFSKLNEPARFTVELEEDIKALQGYTLKFQEKQTIHICEQCPGFEEKNKKLHDDCARLKLEISKLKEELEKSQDETKDLESVVEKLQDFILIKENSSTGKDLHIEIDEEKQILCDKVHKLEDTLNIVSKENKLLKENLKNVCDELEKYKEQIEQSEKKANLESSTMTEFLALEKEYDFIMMKNKMLLELKSRFLELVQLIREKNMLDEEFSIISNQSRNNKSISLGDSYAQICEELKRKHERIQDIVSCFSTLN